MRLHVPRFPPVRSLSQTASVHAIRLGVELFFSFLCLKITESSLLPASLRRFKKKKKKEQTYRSAGPGEELTFGKLCPARILLHGLGRLTQALPSAPGRNKCAAEVAWRAFVWACMSVRVRTCVCARVRRGGCRGGCRRGSFVEGTCRFRSQLGASPCWFHEDTWLFAVGTSPSPATPTSLGGRPAGPAPAFARGEQRAQWRLPGPRGPAQVKVCKMTHNRSAFFSGGRLASV
nr:PREDICTED: uncharacterized protein LOC103561702 [Equus przewalskii]